MNSSPWWRDVRFLAAGDALRLEGRPVGISTVPDPGTERLIDAFRECGWIVQGLVVGTAYLSSPAGDMAMIQVDEDDPEKVIRVELNGRDIPVATAARHVREQWRWQA